MAICFCIAASDNVVGVGVTLFVKRGIRTDIDCTSHDSTSVRQRKALTLPSIATLVLFSILYPFWNAVRTHFTFVSVAFLLGSGDALSVSVSVLAYASTSFVFYLVEANSICTDTSLCFDAQFPASVVTFHFLTE
jgi:hypothetical protein